MCITYIYRTKRCTKFNVLLEEHINKRRRKCICFSTGQKGVHIFNIQLNMERYCSIKLSSTNCY